MENAETEKIKQLSLMSDDKSINQKSEKKSKSYKNKANKIEFKEMEPKPVTLKKDANELVVITRAKDLVKYVIQASNKAPKQFRFTLVMRMQTIAIEIVEYLYKANEVPIKAGDVARATRREGFQNMAVTQIKILEYLALLAYEENCILLKQYEQIAKKGAECLYLLNSWIESDKRRFIK